MDIEIISAKELPAYVAMDKVLIVDLRDRDEYMYSHLPGAKNIPYERLETQELLLNYENYFRKYDKVLVYCERGNQSMMVARMLVKMGIQGVTFYGGMKAYEFGNNRRKRD